MHSLEGPRVDAYDSPVFTHRKQLVKKSSVQLYSGIFSPRLYSFSRSLFDKVVLNAELN